MLLLYTFLIFILSCFYFYFLYSSKKIWDKIRIPQIPLQTHFHSKITVLIAARNEEKNIKPCLESITHQNYDPHLFEIILIDDHSEDTTIEQAKSLGIANLKIITNKGTGKKKGIETGISLSSGNIILCTDADCVVPPNWLSTMAWYFEYENAALVAAPVVFSPCESIFEQFQALDFCGMMCITGAGIRSKRLLMCNGANLAYLKNIFEEVGGFEGVDALASGDDILLMQKIAMYYPHRLVFAKHKAAIVRTQAEGSLKKFLAQRIRWASKSGGYVQKTVDIYLGLIWLFCFTLLLNIGLGLFWASSFLYLSIFQIILKLIADIILQNTATDFFEKKEWMLPKIFLYSFFMHTIYIVVVGFLGNLRQKYEWKGRKVY